MAQDFLTTNPRPIVQVSERLAGWWTIAVDDGPPIAQYTSEFQAREAGRVNAVRLEADLVIHQRPGRPLYQRYDAASGTLSEPSFDPDAPSGPGGGTSPASPRS